MQKFLDPKGAFMSSTIMIYGSNGYTGNLIAKLAVSKGMRPILAGRNDEKIRAQAKELGLDARVFALDDTAAADEALAEVAVVSHCAGPFSRTAPAMAEAMDMEDISRISMATRTAMREFQHALQYARVICKSGKNPPLEAMTHEMTHLGKGPGGVALLKQRKLGAGMLEGSR